MFQTCEASLAIKSYLGGLDRVKKLDLIKKAGSLLLTFIESIIIPFAYDPFLWYPKPI